MCVMVWGSIRMCRLNYRKYKYKYLEWKLKQDRAKKQAAYQGITNLDGKPENLQSIEDFEGNNTVKKLVEAKTTSKKTKRKTSVR